MLLGNQNPSDVKSKVIFTTIIAWVIVKWSSVGNVENWSEHHLSFSFKVNPVHWGIRLFAQTFIKVNIVFLIDIILISEPKGLIYIDLIPLKDSFLYLLRLLLFLCFLYFNIIITFGLLLYWSINLYFFLFVKVDGKVNELWVLFY